MKQDRKASSPLPEVQTPPEGSTPPEHCQEQDRQRKKEANKVRKQLQSNGLFQNEMQQQLDALAMDWQLVKMVFNQIQDEQEAPIFEMETEKGDTYKQVNPLWNLYKELRKLHNQTLDRLGMNLTRQKKFDVNNDEETGCNPVETMIWKILQNGN